MTQTMPIGEASRRGLIRFRRVQPESNMDALVEGYSQAAERLLAGGGKRKEAQESFDRFAVAIMRTANPLPAVEPLIEAGITSEMIWRSLVSRGILVPERQRHFTRVVDPLRERNAAHERAGPVQLDAISGQPKRPSVGLSVRYAIRRSKMA